MNLNDQFRHLLLVLAEYSVILERPYQDEDETTFLTLTPRELAFMAAGLTSLVLSSVYLQFLPEIDELMGKVTTVTKAQHPEVGE